jgi:dihydroxy-acid dehydratase
LVKDGDTIRVSLKNESIELEVSQEEINKRMAEWVPVVKEDGRGLLSRYSRQVGSALDGAVLKK